MSAAPHIAIAGGGASGLLLAHAALAAGASVTIVEPRERLGAGIAYSTDCPLHVLNAPAAAMSAVYDEPDHFLAWLASIGEPAAGSDFVPRSTYGRYLDAIAERTRDYGARFTHIRSDVRDCEAAGNGVHVTCADGTRIDADMFVVAVGNAEPSPWPRIPDDALASQRYFRSAWAPGAIVPRDADETVVLLGTGLTAIDATLGLRYNGQRGPIVMISRRGLLPHEQRVFDSPPSAAPDAESVRDLIGALRLAARDRGTRGWRGAIDQLRSHTNERWRALSLDDQRRIVRHVLPYWNVHRHRVAPAAAKMIAEQIAAGGLRMIAGRTEEIAAHAGALRVNVRLRGSLETVALDAGRIINCSGPQNDFTKLPNPLIRRLIERGYLVPHALGIGAEIAPDGALVGAGGTPSQQLYAIGPVRYGTLIETTAIPEIRVQAHELATLLAQERALNSSSGISDPSTTFGTK